MRSHELILKLENSNFTKILSILLDNKLYENEKNVLDWLLSLNDKSLKRLSKILQIKNSEGSMSPEKLGLLYIFSEHFDKFIPQQVMLDAIDVSIQEDEFFTLLELLLPKIPRDLLEKIKKLTDEYMNNDDIVRINPRNKYQDKYPFDINLLCIKAIKMGVELNHIFNIDFKKGNGKILFILNFKFEGVLPYHVYEDASIINQYLPQILDSMISPIIAPHVFSESVSFFKKNKTFLDSIMDKIQKNPAPQYVYYGLKRLSGFGDREIMKEDNFLVIDNLVRSIMLHKEKYFKFHNASLNEYLFLDIDKLYLMLPDLDEEVKQELRKNPDVILIFMDYREPSNKNNDFNQFVLEWREKKDLIGNTQMIAQLCRSSHLFFQLPQDLLIKIATDTRKHLGASESLEIVKKELGTTSLTPRI